MTVFIEYFLLVSVLLLVITVIAMRNTKRNEYKRLLAENLELKKQKTPEFLMRYGCDEVQLAEELLKLGFNAPLLEVNSKEFVAGYKRIVGGFEKFTIKKTEATSEVTSSIFIPIESVQNVLKTEKGEK